MISKDELARQWEEGFTACALLMSGRYEDYARKRDEWLKLKDKNDER